jgi:hypothetical protein
MELQILGNSAAAGIFTSTYTPTLDLGCSDSHAFFYNINILPDLIILELEALARKTEYIVEKLSSAKV